MNHDWCAVVLSILSEQTRGVNELIRLTNKNSYLAGWHGATYGAFSVSHSDVGRVTKLHCATGTKSQEVQLFSGARTVRQA